MTLINGEQLPSIVGQIDSLVRPGLPLAVVLPPNLIPQSETLGGRYFLVRCSNAVGIERGADWSIYLRRPLFVCGRQPREHDDRWQLYLPIGSEEEGARPNASAAAVQLGAVAGLEWLAQRIQGEHLNLDGPFGNGFTLQPLPHNLLLLVDVRDGPAWFWQLLPLCEQALDRGGRVTILLQSDNDQMVAGLVPWLPVQVEVRAASSEKQWLEQLRHTVGWADKVCAGVRPSFYGDLLRIVRDSRFNIDKGFVQVLVKADLLCAVGACLVCAISTARGGLTRACVNGPVFDLTDLAA